MKDSNKIKFINLGVVVYLLRICKLFEWTSKKLTAASLLPEEAFAMG
jgi:hypothetical protein